MKLSQELYMDKQGVVHLRGFIVIPLLNRLYRVESKTGYLHGEFASQVDAVKYIIKRTG